MAERKNPFDLADLQKGAKGLSSAPSNESKQSKASSNSSSSDNALLLKLEDLYEKHHGDLDDIFDELNEDPKKAKKYPPKNGRVFAEQYCGGYYSYVDEAESK